MVRIQWPRLEHLLMRKLPRKRLLDALLLAIFVVSAIIWLSSHQMLTVEPEMKRYADPTCQKLFNGETISIDKNYIRKHDRSAEDIFMDTTNCDQYKQSQHYILSPINEIEATYPLAFSILLYKDPSQFEMLFRAVYRPQNFYCIHVDEKSKLEVAQAVKGIVNCFDNVFLLTPAIDVQWGNYTVLKPDVLCMRKLLKYVNWKYFINLTGQEYPIRTNYELVQILKAYNNANDIEGLTKRTNPDRWGSVPAPHNIRPMKCSVHILATRAFVNFLLHDVRAVDFHEWTKSTKVPDETLFGSINFNEHLQTPGGYNGKGLPDDQSYNARMKIWKDQQKPCHGLWSRDICIFGIGDLPVLYKAKQPFANKFDIYFEPLALDCMEEWYFKRIRDELKGSLHFDDSYYRTLTFVKNHF